MKLDINRAIQFDLTKYRPDGKLATTLLSQDAPECAKEIIVKSLGPRKTPIGVLIPWLKNFEETMKICELGNWCKYCNDAAKKGGVLLKPSDSFYMYSPLVAAYIKYRPCKKKIVPVTNFTEKIVVTANGFMNYPIFGL